MEDIESLLLFMFVSFCLALVIVMKKESIPKQLRKILAIITLIMVGSSFLMFIVALFLAE